MEKREEEQEAQDEEELENTREGGNHEGRGDEEAPMIGRKLTRYKEIIPMQAKCYLESIALPRSFGGAHATRVRFEPSMPPMTVMRQSLPDTLEASVDNMRC